MYIYEYLSLQTRTHSLPYKRYYQNFEFLQKHFCTFHNFTLVITSMRNLVPNQWFRTMDTMTM
jgi:hypothetical protein